MKHLNPDLENTNEDPEYEVRKVLEQIQWDGTLPIDLLKICDKYDFECRFKPEEKMAEPGTTKFISAEDFYILINTHNTDCEDGFSSNPSMRRRQRFTLAHEIGHCIYKSHSNFYLQKNLTDKSNPYSKGYIKKREAQANEFAAHLLVPKKAFEKISRRISNMTKLIESTSEEFDISLEVAIQQIAKLANYPCITIIFDPSGIPKRIPTFSADFQETKLFYPKDLPIPNNTLAHRILNTETQDSKGERSFSEASTWFPDTPPWRAEKFSIKETSIKTGKYGVATILEVMEQD
jgi:Zn-dependent peptidase ImmA (M78 family)